MLASHRILCERKWFALRILYERTGMCGKLPVRYSLVAENLENAGENYGVLVESGGERLLLRGITVSQRRIQALLRLLMAGNVTAVTARDVVEDWLLH